MSRLPQTIPIHGEIDVIQARVNVAILARQVGLSRVAEASVVAATAALARMLRHGGEGTITIQRLDHGLEGVEVICQGNGLGEVPESLRRLVDELEVQCVSGAGKMVRICKRRV